MLNIRIELWPYGDKSKAKVLGECRIANDDTGTRRLGNYTATILTPRGKVLTTGKVTGFPRLELDSWHLLRRVLQALLGDEPRREETGGEKGEGRASDGASLDVETQHGE